MNTLSNPTLSSYRHGEFLQFMKNVLSVYNNFDLTTLSLSNPAQLLQESVTAMEVAFQPIMAHELTSELANLDTRRDKALMGIKAFLESQFYREETEIYEAAKNLYDNYISHGERIDRLSYQQETAVIDALLKDWSEESLHTAVQTLQIDFWVEKLRTLNTDFNIKYVKRAQDTPKPAELDTKRTVIKKTYEELTADTVAYSRVATDKQPYQDIINGLNGLIEDYNMAVNLRLAGKGTDTEEMNTEPTQEPTE